MTPVEHGEVIGYWFQTLSPDAWYGAPSEVDAEIARRFGQVYETLSEAVSGDWLGSPQGRLAAILVLDQFPRNIHRGTPEAFRTDEKALALAKDAIAAGADRDLPPEQRAFLYMPFQHAENLEDQHRSLELFESLGNANNLDFAVRHYEIIRRFGRFPHRNAILGRASTPAERAFLNEPGSSF
ncbi:hypothetical protein AUC68_05840 [Methyloceanibacter methanicus]|uniref:DUF924 domain-containing protein n=1 Tax=Methyloceanibacter methanicus TaxID=1774968 RepID=A0A1E3W119_9HYPH|nr:DUF924 family protein [Methyloceanibacter methanicus]ODR99482.1 hypothetical protein AUC68_05840 [Methyloceanibacter methanicus]